VFDVAEIVSVICVPLAVEAFTLTTVVKVAAPVEPAGMFGFVQVITPVPPTAGLVQVQPEAPAPDTTIDWKVVFVGTTSVIVASMPLMGPLLITVCVYVMLLPGTTGLGTPEFVTAMSAAAQ
jgi:hypothetical protein